MRQAIRGLREGVGQDWPILAGAGAVWTVLVLALAAKGVDGLLPASYKHNLILYVLTLIVLVMLSVGRTMYRERPPSPIGFLVRLIASGEWARRLCRGLPVLAALVVFMPAFSAMKSSIPAFNAQNWDAAWIAADQAIHGGDPWRLLQPVLGFPIVTSALSLAYFVWFFVVYATSIHFCFLARDSELRARFFITYFASWTVIGVVMATLFASVGPCFAGPLLGDHRFDEQTAYLRAANEQFPVLILRAQDFLLAARMESSNGLGAGISAMPSMHVAMALLVALALAGRSRAAAIAGYGFFVVILIGSVHLGPHYAVDGYVSIAATLALWAVAGRLARAIGGRSGSRQAAVAPVPGIATA